jgi:hypothetical protein
MEEGSMNGLVPPDQLHWSAELKCYTIISRREMDDLIEACFRTGMREASEIVKVVKEYERVRSGQLLFDQFLAGNIGVYEFEEDGSPIFEKIRNETVREISFESTLDGDDPDSKVIDGRAVSFEGDQGFNAFALYESVVGFCSRWGVDLLGGENPEEEAITREEPEFIAEMRRRSWRIAEVEKIGGTTRFRVMFTGNWLRTNHES